MKRSVMQLMRSIVTVIVVGIMAVMIFSLRSELAEVKAKLKAAQAGQDDGVYVLCKFDLKPDADIADFRPVCLSLDGRDVRVESWADAFSTAVSRLSAANPATFAALQNAGELEWLGCVPNGDDIGTLIEAGRINPQFADWAEVVSRVQWLFLMCGIRLNEVIVQVDPYTNEEWKSRKAEIDRKRADEKVFMEGRRAAQKAWAEEHAGEVF